MVSTTCETQPMIDQSNAPWLFYTDLYQRYQFRYPADWTIIHHDKDVHLQFGPAQDNPSLAAASDNCRMVVFKPQPFHDLINLEAYLEFKDYQMGFPYTVSRAPVADLRPGYRAIREVVTQPNGKMYSYIYMSYQARMMAIFATIPEGLETDIKLARSVRFL